MGGKRFSGKKRNKAVTKVRTEETENYNEAANNDNRMKRNRNEPKNSKYLQKVECRVNFGIPQCFSRRRI